MPDIYTIHNRSKVSLRTLRKLEGMGYLKVDKQANPDLARVQANLRKGNPLTVEQLVLLQRNPDWLRQLGEYEDYARDRIDELGDTLEEAMPWKISSRLLDAAAKDAEAIEMCARWLCQHIDTSPAYAHPGRPYAYVAVRMLADVPDNLLRVNIPIINGAITQIRKHPAMLGRSYLNDQRRTYFVKAMDL